MGEAFFIDGDGNSISIEGMESHIGLAHSIIDNDEQLKEEFKNSGIRDVVDFLISSNGYMKVNNIHLYKTIEYFGPKTSLTQRKLIMYYYEQGYKLTDLSKYRLRDDDDDCR